MTRRSWSVLVSSMVLMASTVWVAFAWGVTVSGMVTDNEGFPVPGAVLTLMDESVPERIASSVADEQGGYGLELVWVAVDEEMAPLIPRAFALYPNYPNPFNPETVIPYDLPAAIHVRMEVLNVLGQWVKTLIDEVQEPGSYAVTWDGLDAQGRTCGAGTYFVRMKAGSFAATRKMMLVDGASTPGSSANVRRMEKRLTGSLYTLTVISPNTLALQWTHLSFAGDTRLDISVDRVARTQIISKVSGGQVELGNRAGVRIPGNALPEDLSISVRALPEPPGQVPEKADLVSMVYRFEPEGMRFNRNVEVTIPYDEALIPAGRSEDDLTVAYWNGTQWLDLGHTGVDTEHNEIRAEVSHFSSLAAWLTPWEAPKIVEFSAYPRAFNAIEADNIQEDLMFSVRVTDPDGDLDQVAVLLDVYRLDGILPEALLKEYRTLWIAALSGI